VKQKNFQSLGPHGFHRVHYYEWGKPDNARVLICVHGLSRNGRDFDDLARVLCTDYRVICPDMPGRGKSEWLTHPEDYTYPQYCADMSALIARSGADTVDWVGTSMGGLIGMLLAAQPRSPIRRLVVNDVGPFIPKASLERIAQYVGYDQRFDSYQYFEMYMRTVSAPFGPLTDAQWRHLSETSVKQHPDGKWGLVYDPGISVPFRAGIADVSLWNYWDLVHCPTLLMRGAQSDLLTHETAEEMTRRGPKAQLVEFAGIGHAPMLMAEDQIDAVRRFLLQTN